jgi:hypothetical protein
MKELLAQLETCTKCGMPFGSPEPEAARSRLYCKRCSNLPQNIISVLEMHQMQLRRQMEQIHSEVPTPDMPGNG